MAIKRPQSAPRRRECILKDDSLDLIPESDHYTRQCICFMCTCGKHSCPAIKKTLYPKTSFSSQYQLTFKKPSSRSPPQRVRSSYSPSPFKMELITTQKQDYKAPDLKPFSKPVTVSSSFSNLKFSGRTKYQCDFPNWGPIDIKHEKDPQLTHETKMKFTGKSSYSLFYERKSSSPEIKHKVSSSPSLSHIKTYESGYESSNKRDFRPVQIRYNTPDLKKHSQYIPTSYSPYQFISMSKKTFTGSNSPFKDPHMIRKRALAD
ncbi:unnamed protein product [Blepharisma stoltei]|uniref:Uncharacterized protein n=1 Tax=Blepharisma stoltei TaxID=1481888 RepID=A0AAU9J689_9CILI|nr:unnamed protein product [Blepharisma stoltei]